MRGRAVDPRLLRIAAAIGVSVESFFEEYDPRADSEFGELIALWSTVADKAGRARILACARTVAGEAKAPTAGSS